jgi:serine phosphatase RsbU (regulator of sigma subunit)
MLEVEIAVAKAPRHGASESGDTLEIVERPGGGFSCVLVDGQGSGRGAKSLSNLIVTRAIGQLKDGARDGVVARAVHDYLYTYRMGQVAATLNILSVDFQSGSILISRNNPAPFYVLGPDSVTIHDEPSVPIGLHPMTKPRITEVALRPLLHVVIFSDGLLKAGERYGEDLELGNFLSGWSVAQANAAALADALLGRAVELDRGQLADDVTIVVLAAAAADPGQRIRRMQVRFPLEAGAPFERHSVMDEEDLG